MFRFLHSGPSMFNIFGKYASKEECERNKENKYLKENGCFENKQDAKGNQ